MIWLLILAAVVAGGCAMCGGEGLGWLLNPGGGSTTPQPPNPSSVGSDYLGLLQGFSQGLPMLLTDQQAYAPQFLESGLHSVNLGLYGTDQNPGYLRDVRGAGVTATNLGRQGRSAFVSDMGTLGPRAAQAVRGTNPQQTALMDALTSTASSRLAAGTELDPATRARVTQSVRNNWASRGLGAAPAAQLDEAVNLATSGQDLLNQREQAAAGAVGLENQTVTQPALGIAANDQGLAGTAMGLTGAATGLASGPGATMINPSQSYDMFNTAYNARAAANIAAANNQAALDAY